MDEVQSTGRCAQNPQPLGPQRLWRHGTVENAAVVARRTWKSNGCTKGRFSRPRQKEPGPGQKGLNPAKDKHCKACKYACFSKVCLFNLQTNHAQLTHAHERYHRQLLVARALFRLFAQAGLCLSENHPHEARSVASKSGQLQVQQSPTEYTNTIHVCRLCQTRASLALGLPSLSPSWP